MHQPLSKANNSARGVKVDYRLKKSKKRFTLLSVLSAASVVDVGGVAGLCVHSKKRELGM